MPAPLRRRTANLRGNIQFKLNVWAVFAPVTAVWGLLGARGDGATLLNVFRNIDDHLTLVGAKNSYV